jgi:hypothetical protein
LILLTAALSLNACSSSDETDPGPPPPPPDPLAIDDLTATAGTASTVTLAWTSPELSDKITIRYDLRHIAFGSEGADWDSWTVAAAPEPDTAPGRARTYEVPGLASGQVYAFGMKASTDGTEWSGISNLVVATAAPVFDTTAPAAVTGLFLYKSTATSLTVAWPLAGDDGIYGQAQSYDARYATEPITPANWDAATPVPGGITASVLPGMMETTITGLAADQEYHAAVIAIDDQGLKSGLSNVVTAMTVDLHTIYVNVEGNGDYPTIEAAIDSAKVGDLILVGPGRYTWANQATGDLLHGLIHVPRNYTDFEVRSIAGPEATILDSQNHGKVMSVTGGSWGEPGNYEYAGITIDGFTFTNGRAKAAEPNPDEGWSGGGLNLHLTDTVVRNCIFTGNEATEGGGLWCGGQGDAVIENCVFENNQGKYGGGIMLINSEPRITVRDCTIRGNHATFRGGGIYAYHVTATLENLLIVGNDSSDKGGGIFFSSLNSGCEMIRCTVADNDANLGSAIMLDNTPELQELRIESSLMAFNTGSAPFSLVVNSWVEIGCTLVFGHDQGNQLPSNSTDLGGNLEIDPLFHDRVDYLLQVDSPCLPGNHPDGADCGVIGARGARD